MRMINPVLRREVKTTLRTRKTFYSIAFYVFILTSIITLCIYIFSNMSYYSGGFDPRSTVALYGILSGFQLGVMFLIVPVLTGSAISGEREKQTMDLMLITKMSYKSIIVGKLMASLVIVLLMIISSMPVYAIIFYYGGVSLKDLFLMLLFLFANAAFVGSMSIFFSSFFKKTTLSVVMSYIFMIVLSFGTYIFTSIVYAILYQVMNFDDLNWIFFYVILIFNPIMSFISILDFQIGSSTVAGLITGMGGDAPGFIRYTWLIHIVINVVLAYLFVLLSANRINPLKGIGFKNRKAS